MEELSANTETIICQEVCDGAGGTMVVEVIPPNPVWTNNKGQSVKQLNMVVIGGPNGLNA